MKQREVDNILTENYMEYARYTIQDRAIVDINDGLKNIHRRIIWSMYLDGLTHNKNRTKSVNAVGSVLRFSPHGDSSVYSACVRLTNDSVLNPLLDGKGAFSTITSRDMQEGASRYTEIRLAPITQELLKDINKNIVEMKDNYDNTRLEPNYLPVTFPLVLANPNLGIAVGIASNICSFNMADIINNAIKIIKNEIPDLMIPDLPTGGLIIYNEDIIREINEKGTGKIKIRAKYRIENNNIIITEIPYTTTREAIIESIIDLVKKGKIKEVIDVNDYSGYEGLNITIDVRKNTNIENLISKLFKMTPLESTFSCNFNVLSDNKPVTLGTFDIIKKWLEFRKTCVIKALEYDVNNKSDKLHLLKGLEKVLLNIDKAISIIRNSKDEEIILNLSNEFSIDQAQSENISNMKLRNINKNYIIKQIKDIEKLEEEVKDLKYKLSSQDEINNIIINDLIRVRDTYGKPRKTEILYEDDLQQILQEELIEDFTATIVLSKEQYIKKNRKYSDNQKLKDGDEILNIQQCSNKGKIILLSNKGNAHIIPINNLEDKMPSQLGTFLPSILDLQKDEYILNMLVTNIYTGYCVIIFENGKIAKIPLTSYQTKQNRKMLSNSLSLESDVVSIYQIDNDVEIELTDSFGKNKIINTKDINEKSKRDTIGVQAHKSTRQGFKIVSSKINKQDNVE